MFSLIEAFAHIINRSFRKLCGHSTFSKRYECALGYVSFASSWEFNGEITQRTAVGQSSLDQSTKCWEDIEVNVSHPSALILHSFGLFQHEITFIFGLNCVFISTCISISSSSSILYHCLYQHELQPQTMILICHKHLLWQKRSLETAIIHLFT